MQNVNTGVRVRKSGCGNNIYEAFFVKQTRASTYDGSFTRLSGEGHHRVPMTIPGISSARTNKETSFWEGTRNGHQEGRGGRTNQTTRSCVSAIS
ncbi:predicted protein [Lichtheimia corymbifera JMRC:FSU:9682]|uniref:Uncharacterized protein n=1 Tax=Lichtheimia corymbifera JMRC:FSU:9682 TaxID=1263082 RepID=A0A068RLC9_9FUNG|nr:predicted protein [Lichtheimia corymbifera JMRC:FSU:9682]